METTNNQYKNAYKKKKKKVSGCSELCYCLLAFKSITAYWESAIKLSCSSNGHIILAYKDYKTKQR